MAGLDALLAAAQRLQSTSKEEEEEDEAVFAAVHAFAAKLGRPIEGKID